jgi:hypothetical protein
MFLAFLNLVLEPYIGVITGTGRVDGVTSFTVAEEKIHGLLVGAYVILALLLAFFIGGLVAGRFAGTHAGLNGAVMGAIVIVIPLVLLLGSIASTLDFVGDTGDVQGRSENLRMLLAALVVYYAVSPAIVLTGYVGARLGGRLGSP